MTERLIIAQTVVPRLPRHAKLRFDKPRDQWIILAPERVAPLPLAASAPLRLSRNIALFKTLVEIRKSDAPPDTWLRAFLPRLFTSSVYDVPGAVDDAANPAHQLNPGELCSGEKCRPEAQSGRWGHRTRP